MFLRSALRQRKLQRLGKLIGTRGRLTAAGDAIEEADYLFCLSAYYYLFQTRDISGTAAYEFNLFDNVAIKLNVYHDRAGSLGFIRNHCHFSL